MQQEEETESAQGGGWLKGKLADVISNWVLKEAMAKMEHMTIYTNFSHVAFTGQAKVDVDFFRVNHAGFTGQ